ncbi:MAG: phosphatase PAP2 family protein [Clostridiales bacterium]|nr:phosphatase PAP2 family protein [Clostridiales bacterium]
MSFLYFLEGLRNPFFDTIFSLITMLGEETAFMAIAIIVFWCFDKFQGYFLLLTGFLGTIINQFLKMLFRIPRPWVKDPNFTVVEGSVKEAAGFSFPSGHTQTSVTLFGGIARANKQKWLRITAIIICAIVPFSRMYLGVHTPLDVFVSIGISLVLIFGCYPLFKKAEENPKVMYIILGSLAVLVLAYTLFVCLYKFPEDVYLEANVHNLESARKNAFTMIGCILGIFVVYLVDGKYIKFETKAVWWAQIIKVVIGLVLVIAVKELMRFPLDALFNGHLIARAIRYFLIVITAGILWPLSFKWFAKLGKNKKQG